jgi:hypothetical protein
MPAIHPARLKKQSALLAGCFSDPQVFIKELRRLFEQYADRVHRPGQSGEPSPLLDAYKIRKPVLQQLLQDLIPLAEKQPETTLSVCDLLWEQHYLEFRQLAANLIGNIPPHPPEPVLQRIQSWVVQESDPQLIDLLFDRALDKVRKEYGDLLLEMIEGWLGENDPKRQRLGIRALLPLVMDRDSDYVPQVLGLIHGFTLEFNPDLQNDILELLFALISRSPKESAYSLRQNLKHPKSVQTAWLIRRSINEFPADEQVKMKLAIRNFRDKG